MGFEIVNRKETNVAENKALGISITSFRPIFISIQQAKQNLINLLLTRKGERLIHSNFGSDLMKLIFEPNILDIKELISDAITEPVSFWLPYIFINNITTITAADDPSSPHYLKITITFSLNEIETESITFTINDGGELGIE